MPPMMRPSWQLPTTGVRLIDDLTGAAPNPPTTPAQPTMRAATPYETYVQPAVLGLRSAARSLKDTFVDETDPTMYMHPLGMATTPLRGVVKPLAHAIGDAAESVAKPITHSLQDLMHSALRGATTDVVEHVDDVAPRLANNASGESAASLEAMGRRAWEVRSGRKLVRMDRGGRQTPFIGEPGDLRPNPGERVGYVLPDGTFEEINRGGR